MTRANKQIIAVALAGVTIIIVIPILINKLVVKTPPEWLTPIAGSDGVQGVWISFWASYLGSIISACVTFVVLYLTIKHNKEENDANRKISNSQNEELRRSQQSLLQYELGKQRIDTLREICTDCFMSISGPKAELVFRALSFDEISIAGLLPQEEFEEQLNRSYFALKAFFPDPDELDGNESSSLERIETLSREVFACSNDMYFFLNLFLQDRFSINEQDQVDDAISKYAHKQLQKGRYRPTADYKFFWEIVSENLWKDVNFNRKQIVSECLHYKQTIDSLLSHEFLMLLAYEEKRNRKTIEIDSQETRP